MIDQARVHSLELAWFFAHLEEGRRREQEAVGELIDAGWLEKAYPTERRHV